MSQHMTRLYDWKTTVTGYLACELESGDLKAIILRDGWIQITNGGHAPSAGNIEDLLSEARIRLTRLELLKEQGRRLFDNDSWPEPAAE